LGFNTGYHLRKGTPTKQNVALLRINS